MPDQHPGLTRKLLAELETWFEGVEAERRTIDDPLHQPETTGTD